METLDDGIGFIKLVDGMREDPALKVVNAARISYDKKSAEFDEKDGKLSKYLWKEGHTSPYRHSFYTFHWKAPLFVFRQAFKYQVGSTWREYEIDGESVCLEAFDIMCDTDKGCSWNEMSGRYVELEPEFYVPKVMRGNPPHGSKQASKDLGEDFDHERHRLTIHYNSVDTYRKYQYMLECGIAKEMARMILPQNIYSQAYWTVSLQGVIHFLQQRLHADAQSEIKQYAKAVLTLVSDDLARLGIEVPVT